MGGITRARTAFDAVQRRIEGAEFADWHGWEWIAGFGNADAEHHAVRTACGVWDESPLRKWRLSGPDALAAADRFFTNDMRSLQPGQVRYGAFCDDDGRMLGDGTVFALASDRCWVITALKSDGEALREAAGELDYEIADATAELPHLQLQGPHARGVLQSLTDADLQTLGYYRWWPQPVSVAGEQVQVARCGYSGELGYELYCAPGSAERLWQAILDTRRVTPYGLNAVETLRQESGLIFIGCDYFPGQTDPYEMNLDRVIRLEKPGFRGQQALRRIAAAPLRRLTTLVFESDRVPAYGAPVHRDRRQVGQVRSACWSPTFGRAIAMAVIDSGLIELGGRFDVEMPDGPAAVATVASYPLYDPLKLRPRG
jgi:aminomethyltransferase